MHGRHAAVIAGRHRRRWRHAACGGDEGGSGARASTGTSSTSRAAPTTQAVADCNKQAGGRYQINYVKLPTDANQQRELIVRRLAAEDDSHRPDRHGRDLDGRVRRGRLDPAVGRASDRSVAEEGKLEGPLKTVRVQGQGLGDPVHQQHAAALVPQGPRVDAPPEDFTWDQMIDDAVRRTARRSRSRRASTRA